MRSSTGFAKACCQKASRVTACSRTALSRHFMSAGAQTGACAIANMGTKADNSQKLALRESHLAIYGSTVSGVLANPDSPLSSTQENSTFPELPATVKNARYG